MDRFNCWFVLIRRKYRHTVIKVKTLSLEITDLSHLNMKSPKHTENDQKSCHRCVFSKLWFELHNSERFTAIKRTTRFLETLPSLVNHITSVNSGIGTLLHWKWSKCQWNMTQRQPKQSVMGLRQLVSQYELTAYEVCVTL